MKVRRVIVINPKNDPRVKADNYLAAAVEPTMRCERCDGTGNELMFMYRRCQACGGDGISRGNEATVKAEQVI